MMAGGRDERHDRVMVCHNVIFADTQFEIEHVKEFALDPTNVALSEYARAHGPVHVLERRIIQVLPNGGGVMSHTDGSTQLRMMRCLPCLRR